MTVSLILLAIFLSVAPRVRAEVLATWSEQLTGGVGTGGIVPGEWRYYLIAPDGTRLFGDVFLNNSDSGQTYTLTQGDPGFDAFAAGITDGVNGTINSRRGPYTTNYPYNLFDGIYGGVYQASDYGRDISEQTLIGSPQAPDLKGATIESISMYAQDIVMTNVGSGNSTASYLAGDLTFTITGTPAPIPEPGSISILAIGALLFMRRRRKQA